MYQGKCYEGLDGSETIHVLDGKPLLIKQLFWNSRINICNVCVDETIHERRWPSTPANYQIVIKEFEDIVLKEEGVISDT